MRFEMIELEEYMFKQYSFLNIEKLPIVFILGAPRTGSTLLYQMMINYFNFFYFSNLINDHFSQTPVCGAAMLKSLNSKGVDYSSSYGKTNGPTGPSEASVIIKRWFGGRHPSQINSSKVIPSELPHMTKTLSAIYSMTGRPILIKNAWNCFRIENLKEIFPNAKFVWIRRDIGRSAESDLKSRINLGSPHIWNSATTTNYKEIQKRQPWEQVVLQQYEYNIAIESDLNKFANNSHLKIWYNDLCVKTDSIIKELEIFLNISATEIKIGDIILSKSTDRDQRILNFISKNKKMLRSHIREG